jgi:mannose-1-phosphate guanylyltransferase
MAGGQGQRLWPWSTHALPKPFHDFLSTSKTLLQATAQRFKSLVDPHHTWVVTQGQYAPLVRQQLPLIEAKKILSEPASRNTAACVAYASVVIAEQYPAARLIVVPADHVVQEEAVFVSTLQQVLEYELDPAALILFGAPCHQPAIGYGYIGYDSNYPGLLKPVDNFVEKPSQERARAFINAGNYAWNMGIFVGNVATFVKNFQTHWPEPWRELTTAVKGTKDIQQETLAMVYDRLPMVSFDKAIVEKAASRYVACVDVGWLDVGTWNALYDLLPKDAKGNVCQGQVVPLQSQDCFIKASPGKLVATYGISNLVIIQQGDSLLICSKDGTQQAKKILKTLEEEGYDAYL